MDDGYPYLGNPHLDGFCLMFVHVLQLKDVETIKTPTEHSFWIQHACFSHCGENLFRKNKHTHTRISYTVYIDLSYFLNYVSSFELSKQEHRDDQGGQDIPRRQTSKFPAHLDHGICRPLRSTPSTGYQVGVPNAKKTGIRGLMMVNNVILLPI